MPEAGFFDWYCSVNWYFLYIKQVNGNVYYNKDYSQNALLATVIAHEIGHAIGFRHTDYANRNYSCDKDAYDAGDIWNEGKDVIFDDMYSHYVMNNTKTTRVVLFLDILKDFNNKFIVRSIENVNEYVRLDRNMIEKNELPENYILSWSDGINIFSSDNGLITLLCNNRKKLNLDSLTASMYLSSI